MSEPTQSTGVQLVAVPPEELTALHNEVARLREERDAARGGKYETACRTCGVKCWGLYPETRVMACNSCLWREIEAENESYRRVIKEEFGKREALDAEAAAKDATIAVMREALVPVARFSEWIDELHEDKGRAFTGMFSVAGKDVGGIEIGVFRQAREALASDGSALLAERDALLAEAAALREALTMHERIDDLSEQIARDDADLSAGSDGRFTDEEKAAMVDELAAIHKRCLAALASSGVPDSVKGHP